MRQQPSRGRAGVALATLVALVTTGIGVVAAPAGAGGASGAPAARAVPSTLAGPARVAAAGGVVEGPDLGGVGLLATQAGLSAHGPGTVQIRPDRSRFRTPEALDTPLHAEKMRGLVGANPDTVPSLTIDGVESADVDGDGHADLVTMVRGDAAGRADGFLAVTYGVGDGRFSEPRFFPVAPPERTYSHPTSLLLTDVDGDGHVDAVVAVATNVAGQGFLSLLRNAGDGTFLDPVVEIGVVDPTFLVPGTWGPGGGVQIATFGANDRRVHVVRVDGTGFEVLTVGGIDILEPTRAVYGATGADTDDDGVTELYLARDGSEAGRGVVVVADLLTDPTAVYVEGSHPVTHRIAAGDVDGDGSDDVVVVDLHFSSRWVVSERLLPLPGRPAPPPGTDLGADPSIVSACPNPASRALRVVDVDGDGHLDLVSTHCQSLTANDVRVAYGDGTGTFTGTHWVASLGAVSTTTTSLWRQPAGLAVFDADGRGGLDVAWTGRNGQVGSGLAVLLGATAHPREFQVAPLLPAGGPVTRDFGWKGHQSRLVDWDGDGHLDLVVLRDADIAWRKGDGTGRFGAFQDLAARGSWCVVGHGTLRVADVDGDGHLDLVCRSAGRAGMAWGAGPGQPVTPVELATLYYSGAPWPGLSPIDVADLDGDGRDDIVLTAFDGARNNVMVWFQGADRAWSAPVTHALGGAPVVAVGDVDGDGRSELVTQLSTRDTSDPSTINRVAVIRADGHGPLVETLGPPITDGEVNTQGQGLADLDGDGHLDLVTVTYIGNPFFVRRLVVRLGDGQGGFETATTKIYTVNINFEGGGFQTGGTRVEVADLDGDGHLDLVNGTWSFGVEILPGNGDGTFDAANRTYWSAGSQVGPLEMGDVDGDGHPDIVAGTNAGGLNPPYLTHALLLNRSGPATGSAEGLAVTAVDVPAAVTVGDDLAVQVTVTNQGADIPAGVSWTTAAWLSEAAGFDPAAPLVASVPRAGPLVTGQSYTVTLTGQARATRVGTARVVVRADATRTAGDGAGEEVVPVTVQAPDLAVDGPPVTITVAEGRSRLIRVPVNAGQTVQLSASPAVAGAVRARADVGAGPGLGRGTQLRDTGPGPLVGALTAPTDGDAYLVVDGLSGAGAGITVTLAAVATRLAVLGAAPATAENGGPVSLTVLGTGLSPDTTFTLVPGAGATGGATTATQVTPTAADGAWLVTFDLGARLGPFDLVAAHGADTATLPGALTVVGAVDRAAGREFDVIVNIPARLRRGSIPPEVARTLGSVTVRNRTGRDQPTPYVRLEADGIDVLWPGHDAPLTGGDTGRAPGSRTSVAFPADVPGSPAGTFPARASVTFPLGLFIAEPNDYQFWSGIWTASSEDLLDWSDQASDEADALGLGPSGRGAVHAALLAAFGTTTRPAGGTGAGPWPTAGGYVAALARAASEAEAAGRVLPGVQDRRRWVIDRAVASADLAAPLSGVLVEAGGAAPGEPLAVRAEPTSGTGPTLTGTSAPDGRFNLFTTDGVAPAGAYAISVHGRLPRPAATVTLTAGTPLAGVTVELDRGLTARGRVTSAPGGGPLVGARVDVVPTFGGQAAVDVTTGPDGRWSAAGLRPGAYAVHVAAPGRATAPGTPLLVTEGGENALDVALHAPLTVTGTLRAPGGAPTEGIVWARTGGTGPGAGFLLAAAEVGPGGAFTLAGLRPGPVVLVGAGDAGPGGSTAVDLAASGTHDVTLAAPATLAGAVVDDVTGDPVEGATVVVSSDSLYESAAATTGADGTFTLPGLPAAPVQVLARGPDGLSDTAAATVDLSGSPGPVELRIVGPRAITGRVVDGDGQPVAGVLVGVAAVPADPDDGFRAAAPTGDDGSYALAVPGPGPYVVRAFGASTPVTVVAGGADPVAADLVAPVAAVTGRVRDGEGDPAGGVGVHLESGGAVTRLLTEPDGTYRFAVRAGATGTVWLADPQLGVAAQPFTTAAGPATVDLAPGPSSISVAVTGVPPEGAGLTLVPDLPEGEEGPIIDRWVAADGTVSFVGLAAGSYQVTVRGAGRVTQRHVAAAPAVLDVALPAGITFALVLVEPDDTGIAGAVVQLVPAAGSTATFGGSALTDDEGVALVTGLAPGTYDVWAAVPGAAAVRVATGVEVAPPPPGPTSRARPDGAPAYDYDPTNGGVYEGHIQPPGDGLGWGTGGPPAVTLRHGQERIPVPVDADGSFRITDPPSTFLIEVDRPGFDSIRRPVQFPPETSGTFDLGEASRVKQANPPTPEPAPYRFPSAGELRDLLFVWTRGPITPHFMLSVIIDFPYDFDLECADGLDILIQAKQAARRARESVDGFNDSLEAAKYEFLNTGLLLAVQWLEVGAGVAKLVVPALRAEAAVLDEFAVIGRLNPAYDETTIKALKALVEGLVGLTQESVALMVGAVMGGDLSLDAMQPLLKSILDFVGAFGVAVLEDYRIGGPGSAGIKIFGTLLEKFNLLKDVLDLLGKAVESVQNVGAGIEAALGNVKTLDVSLRSVEWRTQVAIDLFHKFVQAREDSDCDEEEPRPRDPRPLPGEVARSVDPNEVVGPAGRLADRWLGGTSGALGYTVHFENLGPGTENPPPGVPLADAPAARVVVDAVIEDTFDRASFAFGDVGWGAIVVDVPDGVQSFAVEQGITVEIDGADVDLVVEVGGTYDPATGAVRWTLRTVDPVTGFEPIDFLAGFLPPEPDPSDGSGQGWLRYTVAPLSTLATGTTVAARADIVFDANDPIGTNTWTNRVGDPDEPDPGCAEGASAAARFVCRVYLDVLGRPADAGGREHWVGRLEAGQPPSRVAAVFLHTPEARRVLVQGLYQQYLGRPGDPAGVEFWAGQLRAGRPPDRVRALILGSAEYHARSGATSTGFVTALYRDVLGREPEPSGLAHWRDQVDRGIPRGAVARRLLLAPEGRHGIVADVYERYLRRRPDGDETGYWVAWFGAGRSELAIASRIIGSDEYRQG